MKHPKYALMPSLHIMARSHLYGGAYVGALYPSVGGLLAGPVDGYTLPCDGRAVSRKDYPELFAVIGHTWKLGKRTPRGMFRIPDFQDRVTF